MPPYAASVAGSKKIPEPIILPVMSAVLDHNPIFLTAVLIAVGVTIASNERDAAAVAEAESEARKAALEIEPVEGVGADKQAAA